MATDQSHIDPVSHMAQQWRQVAPALDTTPLLVLGRLQRIQARADVLLRARFAAEGLGPGEFDVLAALRRHDPTGPIPAGELAQATLVTAGAATKRVDRLVAAGLATRSRASTDGRSRSVSLTDRGRQLTDRLMAAHMNAEADILSALTRDEQSQLAGLLAQLLHTLESAQDDAKPAPPDGRREEVAG